MSDIRAQADAILASKHRTNAPHRTDPTKRIVGWIVDADAVGLSDAIFALEEIEKRAAHTQLGSEHTESDGGKLLSVPKAALRLVLRHFDTIAALDAPAFSGVTLLREIVESDGAAQQPRGELAQTNATQPSPASPSARDDVDLILAAFASPSSSEAGEQPVAWQLVTSDGSFSRIIPIDAELEITKLNWAPQIKEGRAQLVPLYAHPPSPREPSAAVRVLESAALAITKAQLSVKEPNNVAHQVFVAGWLGEVEAALSQPQEAVPVSGEWRTIYPADFTAELLRLKNRFDRIFNNVLCDMKPGWDDSIEGFNKAWDVARDIFQEEIGRAAQAALRESAPPSAQAADIGKVR